MSKIVMNQLQLNGSVVGYRFDLLNSDGDRIVSFDVNTANAKAFLSMVNADSVEKGQAIKGREVDGVFITPDESNVIEVSEIAQAKDLLEKYYFSSQVGCLTVSDKDRELLSGCKAYTYAEIKFNKLLSNVLACTKLKYKNRSMAISPYEHKEYFQLFFEGTDMTRSYDEEFGTYISVYYSSESGSIVIVTGIERVKKRTVRYINGGSDTFANFDTLEEYKRRIPIIKSKLIDISEVDNGRYYSKSMLGSSVNHERFFKNYPNYIAFGWYALPSEYVEELLGPIFKEVAEFFKVNIPKLIQKMQKDDIFKHLNEFRSLSKERLKELASTYPRCYYCNCIGTPTFDSLTNTKEHMEEMSASYFVILGFRRYLVWNNELYLWFGPDDHCNTWT